MKLLPAFISSSLISTATAAKSYRSDDSLVAYDKLSQHRLADERNAVTKLRGVSATADRYQAESSPEQWPDARCADEVCPEGWAHSPIADGLKVGNGNATEICCQKTCKLWDCDEKFGFLANVNYSHNLGYSNVVCCDRMCQTDWDCDTSNTKLYPRHPTTRGASVEECCGPRCKDYQCTNGWTYDRSLDEVFDNSTEGCCVQTCALYDCSAKGNGEYAQSESALGQRLIQEKDAATVDKIQRLTEEKDATDAKIRELTEDKDAAAAKIRELTEENDSATAKIRNLTEEKNATDAKIRELTEEQDIAAAKIRRLTEDKDAIAANISELTEGPNLAQCCSPLCFHYAGRCGRGYLFNESMNNSIGDPGTCCYPVCDESRCPAGKFLRESRRDVSLPKDQEPEDFCCTTECRDAFPAYLSEGPDPADAEDAKKCPNGQIMNTSRLNDSLPVGVQPEDYCCYAGCVPSTCWQSSKTFNKSRLNDVVPSGMKPEDFCCYVPPQICARSTCPDDMMPNASRLKGFVPADKKPEEFCCYTGCTSDTCPLGMLTNASRLDGPAVPAGMRPQEFCCYVGCTPATCLAEATENSWKKTSNASRLNAPVPAAAVPEDFCCYLECTPAMCSDGKMMNSSSWNDPVPTDVKPEDFCCYTGCTASMCSDDLTFDESRLNVSIPAGKHPEDFCCYRELARCTASVCQVDQTFNSSRLNDSIPADERPQAFCCYTTTTTTITTSTTTPEPPKCTNMSCNVTEMPAGLDKLTVNESRLGEVIPDTAITADFCCYAQCADATCGVKVKNASRLNDTIPPGLSASEYCCMPPPNPFCKHHTCSQGLRWHYLVDDATAGTSDEECCEPEQCVEFDEKLIRLRPGTGCNTVIHETDCGKAFAVLGSFTNMTGRNDSVSCSWDLIGKTGHKVGLCRNLGDPVSGCLKATRDA